MRRFIVAILVIGVLALAASDAWRIVSAQRTLRDTTFDLTGWAAEHAAETDRDTVARELANQAAPAGVRVTQYGQTEIDVQVWTEIDVTGTVVAATVANMVLGKSYAEAQAAPLVLHHFQQTRFQ